MKEPKDKIHVMSIESRQGHIVFGVERHPGDEEEYKKFLKERELIDINGVFCQTK